MFFQDHKSSVCGPSFNFISWLGQYLCFLNVGLLRNTSIVIQKKRFDNEEQMVYYLKCQSWDDCTNRERFRGRYMYILKTKMKTTRMTKTRSERWVVQSDLLGYLMLAARLEKLSFIIYIINKNFGKTVIYELIMSMS